MILRLTENVPSIYVDESRDFQLLCRLFDSSNQEIKFNILTMLDAYTPTKFSNRMLHLLADRVGFKTKRYIDDRVLRYIIAAFPYIIKNKGTRLGIKQAVNTILKAENSLDTPFIEVNSQNVVIITTPITIFNRVALDELLKYVMPTGYYYNLSAGTRGDLSVTTLPIPEGSSIILKGKDDNDLALVREDKLNYDNYTSIKSNNPLLETILGEEDSTQYMVKNYVSAVGTTIVAPAVKEEEGESRE